MLKFAVLGIIQGITEFFPVSSSGHLVIMQKLFNMNGNEVALSVVLHLGTTLALVIYLYQDIIKLLSDKKSLLLVISVTLITGIIGILGKDFFEGLFATVRPVAVGLIFTGTILIITKKFMEAKKNSLGLKDAVILGFVQGVAIVPGISRSGITISTLLFRGLDRASSFKFSFLVAIPAVLGATILEARKITAISHPDIKNFVIGFICSLISGFFSLWALKRILKRAKLYYFGYYCIIIAIIILLFIR